MKRFLSNHRLILLLALLAEGPGSRIAELGAVLMGRPKEHSEK